MFFCSMYVEFLESAVLCPPCVRLCNTLLNAFLNFAEVRLYTIGLQALFKYIIILANEMIFKNASRPILVTFSTGVKMSQRETTRIGNKDTKKRMIMITSMRTTCFLERRAFTADLSFLVNNSNVSELSFLIIFEYIVANIKNGKTKNAANKNTEYTGPNEPVTRVLQTLIGVPS